MDREYVGVDFHRRRSVIARVSAAGDHISTKRLVNDPLKLLAAVAEAGPEPEVVIEATYGWYWVVDLLAEHGARVHLANPQALNWGQRRVKNDERDAIDLADMLVSVACRRPGSHRRPPGSCASWSATGPAWSGCALGSRPRCTR